MAWRVGAVVASALVAGCGGGSPPRDVGTAAPGTAAPQPDAHLFVHSGCGACHTLRAAGTRGRSGPDLDTSERLSRAQIRAALTEGANGMPNYEGRLNAAQLDALAAFIYRATHARRFSP